MLESNLLKIKTSEKEARTLYIMLVPPHATVSASISSSVDAWIYKRRRLGIRVALVGTERPSAVKRFRKLSVFRSRGHQGVLNSSSSRSSRLDDAHAPIGFLIARHGENGICPPPPPPPLLVLLMALRLDGFVHDAR